MRNYIYMLLLLLTTIVFIACNESALIEEFKVEPPVITEFSPKSGDVGTEITIIGENLDRIDQVQIGG
ncbi:IPT/TIG domain-containing protein, partial [Proteiniphilum sp. UBA1028]|uniref:IPT/TIG domain-containing protein n=1 Tax=Proteiniphilum sp. UBA1028 TaxID=1947251 RepID=UPI0025EFE9EE